MSSTVPLPGPPHCHFFIAVQKTDDANGAGIEWCLDVFAGLPDQPFVYLLEFRYANGSSTNRSADILANDSYVLSLDFESTGSWTTWATKQIELSYPPNDVRLRMEANQNAGLPNIDYIYVLGDGRFPASCDNNGGVVRGWNNYMLRDLEGYDCDFIRSQDISSDPGFFRMSVSLFNDSDEPIEDWQVALALDTDMDITLVENTFAVEVLPDNSLVFSRTGSGVSPDLPPHSWVSFYFVGELANPNILAEEVQVTPLNGLNCKDLGVGY